MRLVCITWKIASAVRITGMFIIRMEWKVRLDVCSWSASTSFFGCFSQVVDFPQSGYIWRETGEVLMEVFSASPEENNFIIATGVIGKC